LLDKPLSKNGTLGRGCVKTQPQNVFAGSHSDNLAQTGCWFQECIEKILILENHSNASAEFSVSTQPRPIPAVRCNKFFKRIFSKAAIDHRLEHCHSNGGNADKAPLLQL